MQSKFIFILALFYISCGNKIVYQKDGVILKRKQLFDKVLYYDQANLKTLKSHSWSCVILASEKNRKIAYLYSNKLSFHYINDSSVLVKQSNDTGARLNLINYNKYHNLKISEFGEGLSWLDSSIYFFEYNSQKYIVGIKNVSEKYSILQLKYSSNGRARLNRKYILFFTSDSLQDSISNNPNYNYKVKP